MPTDPVQQYPAFLLVGFNFNIHYCWCDATNTHDCWPRVRVKRHVCWFSTTLLNTRDVNDVGYDKLVALRGSCSVKLQQICLRTWYYLIKHASWSIWKSKRKATWPMPLHQTCQQKCETLSAKTATLSIQHTCCVESYVAAAAATHMPASLVLLSPTLLLFKHAYWLIAAARWMLAGLWPLN